MEKYFRIGWFSFVCCLFATTSLRAQTIKGRVTAANGEPIVSATLFVKELRQGTAANEEGYYELKMPVGSYTCVFQSIGYETAVYNLNIRAGATVQDVVLKEKIYEIREVVISNNREDPAYGIMRRAIAMAPYYLNQVSAYKAELYLKGSLHIVKISKIVKRMAKEQLEGIEEGNTYVEESINDIEFAAPNKYRQKVRKRTGNMPENENVSGAMEMVTTSVYDPDGVLPYISPLSTGAFAHYRFIYQGFVEEGGRIINKIQVKPLHKGKQLFSGYIYIADNFWNVHSMDMSGEFVIGGNFRMRINFGEVNENVWLPVGHHIDFNGSILGNKGDFRYISSIKYNHIVENASLRKPDALLLAEQQRKPAQASTPAKTSASPTSKNSQKIEKILAKEDLSNHDAYKLAKLMEKESKKDKTGKESLNLTESYSDDYKVEVDSNAHKRDTVDWEGIRPVPLLPDELKGYREKETRPLAVPHAAQDTQKKSRPQSKFIRTSKKALWGSSIKLGKQGGVLEYRGLRLSKLGFNTVDGCYIGQKIGYYKDFTQNRKENRLTITPEAIWAINRKAVMWSVQSELTYAPLQRGRASLSFGHQTTDFAGTNGMYPLENTVASLFFRHNYMKLYDSRFLKASHSIDIANGLQLSAEFRYEQRKMPENSSDYSFFYRNTRAYTPNIPQNAGLNAPFPDHSHASFAIDLSYTPRFYYRIDRNNRKRMVKSDFPTFMLGWQKGVPGLLGSDSDFDLLTAEITQNINIGVLQTFRYTVNGGLFVNNSALFFPDFKHFQTMKYLSMRPYSKFHLLEYYRYSTADRYLEAHLNFSTPYLVLKYLPFFSDRLWNETLQLDYLHTPQLKNYVEAGYTIGLFLRAGVFVGFEQFKYRNVGVNLAIPISMLLN
jgi:hypothetical protein